MFMVRQILKKLLKDRKKILALGLVLILSACDKCSTYQEYVSNGTGNNCMLCPMFDILTESASNVANRSWNLFAMDLSNVIMYVTAIYIAFFSLKMVGSFGRQAFADYLTNDKKGVLILGFKLAVISLLLRSDFFVREILIPVLQSGLHIGQSLSVITAKINWGAGDSGSWDALFSMINQAVRAFNDQIYEHIALGNAMICHSTKGLIFSWYWLMLCYGLLFFVFGWFLLAYISFFIVDILINLAIGAMLLPFGIAFAISDKTMGYTKKIWQIFLGVFFNFVMLGIILGLSVQLIELAMGKLDQDTVPDVGVNSFLGEISKMLDNNNVEEVSSILWTSGCLLLAIVCFCLAGKLVQQVKELSQSISDAIGSEGLTSSGSLVGTKLVSTAIKGGKKIGGYTKETGKYGAHVISRITRLDKGLKAVSNGATSLRGILTGTGREGYRAWWRK